jgi:hypothetical protein
MHVAIDRAPAGALSTAREAAPTRGQPLMVAHAAGGSHPNASSRPVNGCQILLLM